MTETAGMVARRRALTVGRVLPVLGGGFALFFIVASRLGEGFSIGGLLLFSMNPSSAVSLMLAAPPPLVPQVSGSLDELPEQVDR